ncbi:50S ribosomal protein L9 [Candidatus Parcubacteria bacterium]|nr:MAG: 50S ribosomal protein L9 [Candidatus Parcubacteria bacterium]
MKVILLADVAKLGRDGDVVEVSEGYAMNFLFPQHLAVEATEKALRQKREKEDAVRRRLKKANKEAQALVGKIDGLDLVITAKANNGKLYAAVTEKNIKEALKKQGIQINKELKIGFSPVKEIGEYPATVSIGDYEGDFRVIIEEK